MAFNIADLFERTVDAVGDRTALVVGDDRLTYAEVDERANRLAHHLIDLGVGPDDLVGIHVGRGLDLVVAAVAVHKAGGAYVPLDTTYPADRLEHMIADSGTRMVLTTTADLARLPRIDAEIEALQALAHSLKRKLTKRRLGSFARLILDLGLGVTASRVDAALFEPVQAVVVQVEQQCTTIVNQFNVVVDQEPSQKSEAEEGRTDPRRYADSEPSEWVTTKTDPPPGAE